REKSWRKGLPNSCGGSRGIPTPRHCWRRCHWQRVSHSARRRSWNRALPVLAVLFLAAAAAWFVGTVTAGGAVMLMIPLVGLLLGAQTVAPAVSLGAFIANPSRAWLFRRDICWPVARRLVAGSLIGAL